MARHRAHNSFRSLGSFSRLAIVRCDDDTKSIAARQVIGPRARGVVSHWQAQCIRGKQSAFTSVSSIKNVDVSITSRSTSLGASLIRRLRRSNWKYLQSSRCCPKEIISNCRCFAVRLGNLDTHYVIWPLYRRISSTARRKGNLRNAKVFAECVLAIVRAIP
jgi:hypothetical protein